jgi:hypothetical protein
MFKWSSLLGGAIILIACAGCNSENGFTPAQEQAARHPVADPNFKPGMTADQKSKMAEAMANARKLEKNAPPVKFTTN